jgi:hypothetical protein
LITFSVIRRFFFEILTGVKTRPVLLVGPLADFVSDKLIQEYPSKFARCLPEITLTEPALHGPGLVAHDLIDYRRRGRQFECTTFSAVSSVSNCVSVVVPSLYCFLTPRLPPRFFDVDE